MKHLEGQTTGKGITRKSRGTCSAQSQSMTQKKKCWVEKEDVGIESYTEAEKGESSDSFKRAGTNWGIGRELYTSPKIIVRLNRNEFNGKKVYTSFYVSDIGYNERREISKLELIDGNGVRSLLVGLRQA